jgi:hypothetical protein
MLDIIIPLAPLADSSTAAWRGGSKWDNNELRYCLRSIEKYATGYDRIFIIGETPGFLVGAVDLNGPGDCGQSPLPSLVTRHCHDIVGNKEARIAHKIFWAFQHTDIADNAVLFNDDYVLIDRAGLGNLPCYHRESLQAAAKRHPDEGYWRALKNTHQALSAAGKPTWHYDIHVPMILERQKFLGLEKWWQQSLKSPVGLAMKSTYANNVLDQPGPLIHDFKLRGPCPNIDAAIAGRWCFSYCDSGLTPQLKQWLANKFPEPSQWETNQVAAIDLNRHALLAPVA